MAESTPPSQACSSLSPPNHKSPHRFAGLDPPTQLKASLAEAERLANGKVHPLTMAVLVACAEQAGRHAVIIDTPVPVQPAGRGWSDPHVCFACMAPYTDSNMPYSLHPENKAHIVCRGCIGKFRNCPVCRAEGIKPEPLTPAAYSDILRATAPAASATVGPEALPGPTQPNVINLGLFDPEHQNIYSVGERWCMVRGNRPYYCPHGWQRSGVKIARFEEEFSHWPVAYHGINPNNLLSILNNGLLNPGAYVPGRGFVCNVHGTCFAKGGEKPIYVSPSLPYASFYSTVFSLPEENRAKLLSAFGLDAPPETPCMVQTALQLRIRPDAFAVNGNTLPDRLWPRCLQVDQYFANDELEWRVADSAHICVYGILMRVLTMPPIQLLQQIHAEDAAPCNQSIVWSWWNSDYQSYIDYSPAMQKLIEFQYQKQPAGTCFFHIGKNHNIYFIDFAQMRQIRFDNPALWRGVERVTK